MDQTEARAKQCYKTLNILKTATKEFINKSFLIQGIEFKDQVIKPSKDIILHSTNKKLSANLETMWSKLKDMDTKIDQIIEKLP